MPKSVQPNGARLLASRVGVLAVSVFALHASLGMVARGAAPQPRGADDELPKVLAAWKRRQDAAKTYRFECTEERQILRGANNSYPGKPEPSIEDANPPRDVSLSGRFTLIIAAHRGRFVRQSDHWHSERNVLIKQESIDVCDGHRLLGLLTEVDQPGGYPVGTASDDRSISHLLSLEAGIGAALCYRILDPDFKVFPMRDIRLRTAPGGSPGELLIASVRQGQSRVDLWLDRRREYLPTRLTMTGPTGGTASDDEFVFEPHPTVGWAPVKWTTTWFGHRAAPKFVRRVVVQNARFNEQFADADFTLNFAPGTWVTDMTAKSMYIVLPNGEKHVLGPDEGVPDYDRIMASGSFWTTGNLAKLACAAVLGAILIGLYRTARRRARL